MIWIKTFIKVCIGFLVGWGFASLIHHLFPEYAIFILGGIVILGFTTILWAIK